MEPHLVRGPGGTAAEQLADGVLAAQHISRLVIARRCGLAVCTAAECHPAALMLMLVLLWWTLLSSLAAASVCSIAPGPDVTQRRRCGRLVAWHCVQNQETSVRACGQSVGGQECRRRCMSKCDSTSTGRWEVVGPAGWILSGGRPPIAWPTDTARTMGRPRPACGLSDTERGQAIDRIASPTEERF